MPQRFPPDDPREWINRARSNLAQANARLLFPEAYLEDLCFQCQQAAEKAIKAVLLHLNQPFPYTHDISKLLAVFEGTGVALPEAVADAFRLTRYALVTRYPGIAEPVTQEDYELAVSIAEATLRWAEEIIGYPPEQDSSPI